MAARVVAIVQARMGSSRLPGKVLADLGGQSALAWVTRRTARAQCIDQVVVATSTDEQDDAIAEFCQAAGLPCTRGSLHDVLDRFHQAAEESRAEIIVRLTGDCPLIDPSILDDNLGVFLAAQPGLDFAANRLPGQPRSIPIGLDAEYCTRAALDAAWREAKAPHQREHVMPFLYENPQRFNILHMEHHPSYGQYRWTLDTPEDLQLLREVATHFADDAFSWLDVIRLFEQQPHLAQINAAVPHKSQYDVDPRQ